MAGPRLFVIGFGMLSTLIYHTPVIYYVSSFRIDQGGLSKSFSSVADVNGVDNASIDFKKRKGPRYTRSSLDKIRAARGLFN